MASVLCAKTGSSPHHLSLIDTITYVGYNIAMYSVREAAPKMGISERHLRLLLKRKEVKGKQLGHDWVVLSLNYKRKRKPKEIKK